MANDDTYDSTVEVTVSRDMRAQLKLLAQQQAILVVLSGGRLGQRVQLSERPLLIGRGSACDIILEADSVSRQHARLEWTGTDHKLVDLGSTNGTFVNEVRIHECVLGDSDRIQIGKALIKYLSGSNIEGLYHEELQRLTRHDALTGVLNRRSFEEALSTALGRGLGVVSLVVFDIDHFKTINDTYGHTAGDAVLRQLAAVVSDVLGDRGLFGRVGGEEFAILMSDTALHDAHQTAEQVRQTISRSQFRFEQQLIPVTVSLGVAERAPSTLETAEQLYARADQQLYAAKADGRNCVR